MTYTMLVQWKPNFIKQTNKQRLNKDEIVHFSIFNCLEMLSLLKELELLQVVIQLFSLYLALVPPLLK